MRFGAPDVATKVVRRVDAAMPRGKVDIGCATKK
jgi:hypothetical protein